MRLKDQCVDQLFALVGENMFEATKKRIEQRRVRKLIHDSALSYEISTKGLALPNEKELRELGRYLWTEAWIKGRTKAGRKGCAVMVGKGRGDARREERID